MEAALPPGVTITDIATGFSHGLALASDGRVLAWGANNVGQLGDGTTETRSTPVEVAVPQGVTHRFGLRAGDHHHHTRARTA